MATPHQPSDGEIAQRPEGPSPKGHAPRAPNRESVRASWRAWLPLLVLVAPTVAHAGAAAGSGTRDLVVTLAPGARLDPMPAGAREVALVGVVIVPNADAALEASIR